MTDVTVPELAESITEASIDAWHVKAGDEVTAGQELVSIETDKVVLEVPAPVAGVVSEIVKDAGSDVASGEVIAKIAEGKAAQDGGAGASAPKAVAKQPAQQAATQVDDRPPTPAGEPVDVCVPELAESVSEAAVAEWTKKPGDYVNAGEEIVKIETDKVVLEVPAPVSGVLQQPQAAVGAEVASGQLLIQIVPSEDKPAAAPTPAPVPAPAQPSAANPAARRMASEAGIELDAVAGSGKGGRVTKGDVMGAVTAAPAAAPAVEQQAGQRLVRREKMSKLRSRVAARLLSSQQQTAMLTTFNEADMSAVLEIRKRYRDGFEKLHGIKLGFMSFFVKAATAALRRHPILNARIDGADIVYHDYCDVGVAVGSPRGLVVPVLRSAEALSVADIEKQIADFGARAQSGALDIAELSSGTFTITNGGVFGSMLSTPIINPPQSAILGVHATKPRPVAENGQVVIRPMNYLALSYDHRLIDGRDAVLFLVAVKEALEDPARMLLDI